MLCKQLYNDHFPANVFNLSCTSTNDVDCDILGSMPSLAFRCLQAALLVAHLNPCVLFRMMGRGHSLPWSETQ